MKFSDRMREAVARRLANYAPAVSCGWLESPCFAIGFNNSGKSTLIRSLVSGSKLCLYPTEGNGEFWFSGFFPWLERASGVFPIWYDPDEFVSAVLRSNGSDFNVAKTHLGAYQKLCGSKSIINDSGMLAALLPHIYSEFPGAKYIHVVRDGRVVSYLAARAEWVKIMRSPGKYLEYGGDLRFENVLERMGRYWAWVQKQVSVVRDARPGALIDVRYEDWCADPKKVLGEVGRFMGLSDDARLALSIDDLHLTNMNSIVLDDILDKYDVILTRALEGE